MANEYTKKDFLKAVAAGTVTEKEQDYAKVALEKLEAVNEKRRNTPSKAAVENQPLVDALLGGILTAEPKIASDVAAELGVSTQKASALLRSLVASGKAVSIDVKVAKRGSQKAYSLVTD